jgi:CRISPR-associated endonuclease Csn1
MQKTVLGLDVGANSIGWALLDDSNGTIVAAGARVFPEGVENYDTRKEKPKMEARRIARGMRRQIRRRAARKNALRTLLAQVGLSPAEDSVDPYSLRRKALDVPLSPAEFGRVLIHLNQRRGFKSNRKTDRGRKADDKGMLGEINWVDQQRTASGSRTIGEMMDKVLRGEWHAEDELGRLQNAVRRIHTRREMLLHEFETIWDKQKSFDSPLAPLLTDQVKKALNNPAKDEDWMHKGLIFGQRNLYWPADAVGHCELEPKLKRCEKADRSAQRFRLLQEVNNLRFLDPTTGDEYALNVEQRTLLLDKLSRVDKMDFDRMRREMEFIDSITFNLERGNRKSIKGLPVDFQLAKKELFGKAWHDLPEERKNRIVRDLIDADDEKLMQLAVEQWGLSNEAAERLVHVELPEGYASLSRTALEKLLPPMERGLIYMSDDGTPCALSEAGYLRPDQRPRKRYDELPEPAPTANPVVRQALHEVRRVVNAIIREYGKPARIHIELARDATKSAEERAKSSKLRQENEDRRSAAADLIRAAVKEYNLSVKLTRDAIDRVLLWREQGEVCAYSGKVIGMRQLLLGEADIDHILPYSRCLDDSMANKVVAFRVENQAKGNQTPREWLEARHLKKYEQVQQFARRLPYNKRKRFTQKELELDGFVARQLNDTGYIATTVTDYLRGLVDEPHHVLCPKGTHTAELRRHWGLNTVLKELPDSPAWIEDADLRDGEKDRADHRHHAIDAIIVALTDQKRLQQISRINRQGGTTTTGEVLEAPWSHFRDSVTRAVAGIKVSHRVRRRVSGALHEDTHYGPVHEKTIDGSTVQRPGEFVVRKSIESLTPSMIEDIRDPTIREIVIARLKQHGVSFGRGIKGGIPKEVWREPLAMASGVPIRKVRIIKRDDTIRPIRGGSVYVKPGSMHHLCIFEWTEKGKKKRGAVFVSTLDAIERIKRHEPIISREHPDRPGARFIMSLSSGEIVQDLKGKGTGLFVFSTAASTSGQMWFLGHAEARPSSAATTYSVKATTMSPDARKVTIDPLGRIRWAND